MIFFGLFMLQEKVELLRQIGEGDDRLSKEKVR